VYADLIDDGTFTFGRKRSGMARSRAVRAKRRANVTLDRCRHGGLTELGDAGPQIPRPAASMHRVAPPLHLYIKKTERQHASAAREQPDLIEANEPGAKVRIERQTRRKNREPK
jgi:hypothetical protein